MTGLRSHGVHSVTIQIYAQVQGVLGFTRKFEIYVFYRRLTHLHIRHQVELMQKRSQCLNLVSGKVFILCIKIHIGSQSQLVQVAEGCPTCQAWLPVCLLH